MTCMTSRRPAKAATGKPPPMALAKVHRSGVTPKYSWAPPSARRKPVRVSSKTISTPYRVHSSRSPSRKPGSGMQPVIFRVTGSMMTQAI